ncbi:EAP30/Vps36 family-domain-containing protein [Podospora fimiseda]|uniref:Vacuolar protein-sorting-associated protein 36 n=1 Tax=Podospora fimiseda TaxID=252190 RepID=A0AAN7BJ36_9PEZI|nr:EAP30/Vps36 family-domain-containing protein [Podospora fimiseda]
MFLKSIDLTTALRPSYLPDEDLLFVQDNVGLYEGKYKLPNHQNGQVYLTSHRICYVDKAEPRKYSVALHLKHVERYEFYAGFLKSSAKITLIPKKRDKQHASLQHQQQSRSSPEPSPVTTATWVCTICSFSNPVPSNFDPTSANQHTSLPPCLACGIKPTLTHVLKAAISNATHHNPPLPPPLQSPSPIRPSQPDPEASFQCPRCTFLNHPSLMSCEICGAPLISHNLPSDLTQRINTESPGPFLNNSSFPNRNDTPESIKLSFRGGGEKIFYERLKNSLTQRKWLLQGAPPIPSSSSSTPSNPSNPSTTNDDIPSRNKMGGIAGLERQNLAIRQKNELVIGTAFEDLEALMASAKQIVELAESFARQQQQTKGSSSSSENNTLLAESVSDQLGLITTKDIVGNNSGGNSLYLSELSRTLAEFLTDDRKNILRKSGGIISLVDLWAVFNRARGGVELVSPADFEKAARLWEELNLPVRLRTFKKSGVMVVQAKERTDDQTVKSLLAWMKDLHEFPPEKEVAWDWRLFGRGVTARDAAERFGWSIGVAEEELEMAEERGVLCREEGIEGLKFWENFIDAGEGKGYKDAATLESERLIKTLKDVGML